MQLTEIELKVKLELHVKWLKNEADGIRADLHDADLCSADLHGADLCSANLQSADLSDANLRGANLQGADLSDADLDFSSWPLWCGSKNVKVSFKLVCQLLAHVSILDCTDNPVEYDNVKQAIVKYAKRSHRAQELGI